MNVEARPRKDLAAYSILGFITMLEVGKDAALEFSVGLWGSEGSDLRETP